MQNAVGTGPSKRLRVYQDLESTVTLKDLFTYVGTPTGAKHMSDSAVDITSVRRARPNALSVVGGMEARHLPSSTRHRILPTRRPRTALAPPVGAGTEIHASSRCASRRGNQRNREEAHGLRPLCFDVWQR